MHETLHPYLSWWQFFAIAVILWLLYMLLRRFKKYIFHFTHIQTLHIPNMIFVVLLVLSFLLVNPVIHGLIVVIAMILLYPVLSSFLNGILAFNNMKLKPGDLIMIDKKRGRISDISLSGIRLQTESNNIFIPFRKLAESSVERYRGDQTMFLSFFCQPVNGEDKLNVNDVERIVFNFPFTEHKSNIEITQLKDKFKVNLSLANNRFRSSLMKQFVDAGYQVELTKK